jgi:triosephosphate isomerase
MNLLDEVHAYLRTVLASLYDEEVAQSVRIQYGGSVTPESVDELMAQPEIDGCLVGGASLDAEKFGRIINFQKVAA